MPSIPSRNRDTSHELPYMGPLGNTRHEPAFIPSADGTVKRVEIVKAVNAATDPTLAQNAIDGSLNRVNDTVVLAVPYIFHDPGAKRFALVVPPSRAHEELSLRADLLTKLSTDTASVIPSYVRSAVTVIGHEGLQTYLNEPIPSARTVTGTAETSEKSDISPGLLAEVQEKQKAITQTEERLRSQTSDLEKRAQEIRAKEQILRTQQSEYERKLVELRAKEDLLNRREEELRLREDRLRARVEEITEREDDLRQRFEETEIQRSDLAVREQELEQRFNELLAREERNAENSRSMQENLSSLRSLERVLEARTEALSAKEHTLQHRERALSERPAARIPSHHSDDTDNTEVFASAPMGVTTPIASSDDGDDLEPIEAHEVQELSPEPVENLEPPQSADLDEIEAEPIETIEPVQAPPERPSGVDIAQHTKTASIPPRASVPPPTPTPAVTAPPTETVEEVEAIEEATPDDIEDEKNKDGSTETLATAEAIEPDEPEEIIQESVISASSSAPGEAIAQPLPPGWAARGQDAYAAVVEGEVRMWVKGTPELASRVSKLIQGASLVLQASPESRLPLALLTVRPAEAAGHNDRFACVVLDHTRPDDRTVVEALARDFRVRLEIVSEDSRALGSHIVSSPGESNAQRVIAALAARNLGSDDERKAETEKLVREGIHFEIHDQFEKDLNDETKLATALGAEQAMRVYEPLTDQQRAERFILSSGVPASKLDAAGKRVILAALRCGVMLSPVLVQHAIKQGLATDEKALCNRALTAYARTCESALDSIGRSKSEASRAWSPLLAWAKQTNTTIADNVRNAIKLVFDPDDPDCIPPPDSRPTPTAEALAAMKEDELAKWADHPGARELVTKEMVRRDPVRFAAELTRNLRMVSPNVAAELVAKMIPAGDALGDVWVELLGSKRPTVSALGATATAVLRLRRGLNPVLQRALAKDNADWKLYAWAAGEFGTAVVRSLGRTEGADTDRLAFILAHAVRAGGGREVERARTTQGGGVLPDAATRAVGRVDEARTHDGKLRSNGGETDAEKLVNRILQWMNNPVAGKPASNSSE